MISEVAIGDYNYQVLYGARMLHVGARAPRQPLEVLDEMQHAGEPEGRKNL